MGPRPSRAVIRSRGDLFTYERALHRRGFEPVAGVDEAGRGACAGPLVVAAVILGRVTGFEMVADSKVLSPARRHAVYDLVMTRALAVSVVVVGPDEVDEFGVHVADLEGMRRALARLQTPAAYALTDGFPVPGLGVPSLAVWKGDQVCASVAAASVVAKVTRDRLMIDLDAQHPQYGFATHKGYVTQAHLKTLAAHGPCADHRRSFAPVARLVEAADTRALPHQGSSTSATAAKVVESVALK